MPDSFLSLVARFFEGGASHYARPGQAIEKQTK